MIDYDVFIKMGYKREYLVPQKEAIYDFTNIAAPIADIITLKTSIGAHAHSSMTLKLYCPLITSV